MSKIFRLHTNGTDTYEGWGQSQAFPYNDNSRKTIEDPEGASAEYEITSIPTPFARIDLVKTAFREVCKSGVAGLDGSTIYHKMVSDALDVGEIFFNIDKFQDKVEIIPWNAEQAIRALKSSGLPGHHNYADTLEKYLQSDADTYHFDQLQNIYLLNYRHGPGELNIIGATSPATLFFSTANRIDYVNDIYFNTDRPFDADYCPLYRREPNYLKAWFALRKSMTNFSVLFREVDNYLEHTFKALSDPGLKEQLNALMPMSIDEFDRITVHGPQQANQVEVLGYALPGNRPMEASAVSEFVISPTTGVAEERLPLVLPVEAGNRYSRLRYTTGPWGTQNAAPFQDPTADLSRRKLPFDGGHTPYLTISDFLEDILIRVPHRLNDRRFFDGHMRADAGKKLSYLLPLRPLLFRYFTADEVCKGLPSGQPMVEMSPLAGGSVKVVLRIPIKGNGQVSFVEYTRLYYNGSPAAPERNEGGMVEFDFTGHLMPHVRFSQPQTDACYSLSCVSTYSQHYACRFFRGEEELPADAPVCRNETGSSPFKSENYLLRHTAFDYLQVSDRNGSRGVLLPLFEPQHNQCAFEFAVDLGTSNTHIAYRKQGERAARPLDYAAADDMMCPFFRPSFFKKGGQDDLIAEKELMERDFLPFQLGDGKDEQGKRGDFEFPTRTALSCARKIDWTRQQEPLGRYNLSLTYQKRQDPDYNQVNSHIKWGDNPQEMRAYVECLMLLMRNKVLLGGGDLSRTRITWFYPISMAPKRLKDLRETWNKLYRQYFAPEGSTEERTESEAPINYYFSRHATATSLINIDIGGGTTDIAFSKNKEISHVTSFKFATDDLFNDAFADSTSSGIVDAYKEQFRALLESSQLTELLNVYDDTENGGDAANMASFLFTLRSNGLVRNSNLSAEETDFNAKLRADDNFRIVFILYYVAIVYHVAHLVKATGLGEPRHLTFSGNGSKIISVITTDTALLGQLTKAVFEQVAGRKYAGELDILGLGDEAHPKEITCLGGLSSNAPSAVAAHPVVMLRGDGTALVDREQTYAQLTDSDLQQTVQAVEQFFDFALNDLNRRVDFDSCFGVTRESLELAKEVCRKDLRTYLDKGIDLRKEGKEGVNRIEESTFFYPIKGALHALAQAIYESQSKK